MQTEWHCDIVKPINRLCYELHLHRYAINEIGKAVLDKDGRILLEKIEEWETSTPLLVIQKHMKEEGLLQSIADGLAEAGIFPTKPDSDRIKAEAIADEREEELNYFKAIYSKLVERLLNESSTVDHDTKRNRVDFKEPSSHSSKTETI